MSASHARVGRAQRLPAVFRLGIALRSMQIGLTEVIALIDDQMGILRRGGRGTDESAEDENPKIFDHGAGPAVVNNIRPGRQGPTGSTRTIII